MRCIPVLLIGWLCWCGDAGVGIAAETPLPDAARQAFDRAVDFFHHRVSAHGGYVYLYSPDLTQREGEEPATPDTVWVQPPGTPAVGAAYVQAYERLQDPACLAAAKDAAMCLLRGQLRSGGWSQSIEFDPKERSSHAYRVDPASTKRTQRNLSTFDDDKTQSALRFLMHLDRVLNFQDETLHEAVTYGLDSVLSAQYPNGGWAQGWEEPADRTRSATMRASYPASWPREFPKEKYWQYYTFNDGNISQIINTLLLAAEIYGDNRYREAALQGGDFIRLAQMPEPQPAWAQQYNFEMHPVWARKFEPPSISGGESQGLISTLMDLYVETGDNKYLEPIPRAIAYLRQSELPGGRMSRFYELQTNRPLYFTKTYELTNSDADLPTHYGFQVDSKVDRLEQRYEAVRKLTPEERERLRRAATKPPRVTTSLEAQVRDLIKSQDERGAWIENGRLQDDDNARRVISSRTFIKNLDTLSLYLAAIRAQGAK